MDVSELLDALNKPQRDAVAAPVGHALIIAGAGSGKTRVLTSRIAWLIKAETISPASILAVTFTNKAATEMRNKIENTLNEQIGGMWVGTFHGLAHRLLRLHWQDADLPQSFQILDSNDQQRICKRIITSMGLDDKVWPSNKVSWYINARKDEGLRPDRIDSGNDKISQNMLAIYEQYEQTCKRAGVIDFGEILLRCYELWLKRPDILNFYQQRFQHILVDEFQDTNTIQYAWLKMLAGDTGHLFVVGDDDQSIYGWRGARIENIQRFSQDYPSTTTIRLEQNYRSTANILSAANAVIANNNDRLGKALWTDDDSGEAIQLYSAYDAHDEANFCVGQIEVWVTQGGKYAQTAVLYRSNAQSRIIENALSRVNMPYRVYGGVRFFERAEIKDVLAYLRLIANRDDDAAFERVVNIPTRGIGAATLAQVRQYARKHANTMWEATDILLKTGTFTGRATNALTGFLMLINSLAQDFTSLSLAELTANVIEKSGLRCHFSKNQSEKGQGRLDNIDELISATQQFISDDNDDTNTLTEFLSRAALEAGDNQADKWQDCVQLMTLHSAKGLEFPMVFIIGMEEGLFPAKQTTTDLARLAEERRLCYVGMTRACKHLYLLHAKSRMLYGQLISPHPSRFLAEIPADYIEEVGLSKNNIAHTKVPIQLNDDGTSFKPGQQVHHHKFGPGIVMETEGAGKSARAQVRFKHAGNKWLVLAYARLEIA